MNTIEFRSDNAAGVAPEIMHALDGANKGSALAYGDDDLTSRLQTTVREVFDHPEARVFPVASGTAANALGLSALCPPWGAVLCQETAHIINSEGGATSMLSAGAVMRGVPGENFLMSPDGLYSVLSSVRWGDPHHSQPAVLSFTQPSDIGTIYQLSEIEELSSIARESELRIHLDGARLANALVALDCSPADLTWRAGVEVITLGATKNGVMSTDAIVSFDDKVADELVYRTKRAGHVTSKMRYQSAQLLAYLDDGLWLRLARNSNERAAQLAEGLEKLGVELVISPDVNMLFAKVADDQATALENAGLLFYRISPGLIRLVTSWQTSAADVDAALAAFTTVA